MEAGLMRIILKLININEMEAGMMKNVGEMEAGLMKKYCWNGRDIDEKILLKWKQDWWE